MKKNIAITLSVFLIIASALGVLGAQFLSGNNPPDLVMFVLMMVIGGSAETIAFSTFKNKTLKYLPFVLAFVLASWGTYLYLTSESWANATMMGLICGYCSPMVGATVSLVLLKKF